MGGDQILIKLVLIAGLVMLMFVLLVQRPNARSLAMRRLTYLVLLIAAIAAVIFPSWLTAIANILGVGRGADLLLYGLVLVFISHSISSKSRHALHDRKYTKLARAMALQNAEPAADAGARIEAESHGSGGM